MFLLDWSGSMRGTIKATILQAISLAMFCRKQNIPFEVLAFTDAYASSAVKLQRMTNDLNSGATEELTLQSSGALNLLNLFSSRMTAHEFITAARRFATYRIWDHDKRYTLNCTPLNDALVYMLDYLPAFIKRHTVQKMSLITLTDGQSDRLSVCKGGSLRDREYSSQTNQYVKNKNFIHDPITKKNYEITDDGGKQTAQLLTLIQDRLGIKSVGFYICPTSRHIHGFISDVCSRRPTPAEVGHIRSNIRKNGYHSVRGLGRDEFFVLYAESLSNDDESIEIDGTTSAKTIAKKFTKQLGNKRLNRNLLEKFISTIA